MIVEKQIQALLTEHLRPLSLTITNDSAKHEGHHDLEDKQNSHFTVSIISEEFIGKTRIQRHQMIYDCLKPLMNQPIHALVIHAHAPGEAG